MFVVLLIIATNKEYAFNPKLGSFNSADHQCSRQQATGTPFIFPLHNAQVSCTAIYGQIHRNQGQCIHVPRKVRNASPLLCWRCLYVFSVPYAHAPCKTHKTTMKHAITNHIDDAAKVQRKTVTTVHKPARGCNCINRHS